MNKIHNNLCSKKIVIGITGSIAAYKSAYLIRLLKKAGAEVQVVMTKSAKEFMQPLTFQSFSGRTVYDEMFNQHLEINIRHISIARWADIILIAPCSANIIGKIANGVADDLLSTICLASKVTLAIVPAMNDEMWLNPATQKNILTLRERGTEIWGPAIGEEASGENGPGRMLEPVDIIEKLQRFFLPKILANKKVLITAGPTLEPIDPVRFISNHSSGKMGYAIAEAAVKMGAKVLLISGPTNLPVPNNVKAVNVTTAQEMYNAVIANIKNTNIFIAAAAVSDYKPKAATNQKIKKDKLNLTLRLIKNPDILSTVAKLKTPPFSVGFCAETENLLKNAKAKLKNKNIDMIAANIVGKEKGFNTDNNKLLVIRKNNQTTTLTLKSKGLLAIELLELIHKTLK